MPWMWLEDGAVELREMSSVSDEELEQRRLQLEVDYSRPENDEAEREYQAIHRELSRRANRARQVPNPPSEPELQDTDATDDQSPGESRVAQVKCLIDTHVSQDETEERTGFELSVDALFDELCSLLLRKHHDYGPRNIADAPGGALNGVLVRMWDKVARIRNLTEAGAQPAQNEPLEDSFKDLANYSVIALLIMRGEWPGVS